MIEKAKEEQVRDRVRRVICAVVGKSPVSDDDNLRDIGVDSFKLIELTAALEAEFAVSIPDESLQWCCMETVGRVSETVAAALSSNAAEHR